MVDIAGLRQKRNHNVKEARGIQTLTEEESRDMTAEEEQRFDKLMDEADKFDEQIARAERLEAADRASAEEDLENPSDPAPGERAAGEDEWFREWIRTGRISEQVRANQVSPDDQGGYLQPPQQFVNQLLAEVDDQVIIRGLATGHQLETAESLGVPTREADVADFEWTTELGTGNEDDSLRFGKRELRPHPLAKRIKVSKKLLRVTSGPTNAEDIVRSRLAYKVGVTQEKAYMTGDGSQKPLGLFVASSDGISTNRDSDVGAGGAIPLTNSTLADQLIDAKYTLKGQYHNRARWLFHRDILKSVRKAKDSDGQYIWQDGLAGDRPATILDIPFLLSEFAPNTVTGGAYVGMLGDFSFYWYVDALDFQIQRLIELYAESNQDGFIGRYEGDGMPVLEEPFVRLKVAS